MKKFTAFMVILLVMLCFGMPAFAEDATPLDGVEAGALQSEDEVTLTVSYKGTDTVCQNGSISEGDITFLPFREILALYGVEISWAKDEAEQKVILTDGANRYQMVVDLKKCEAQGLDGKTYMLRHEDNILYLPIHFYAQLVNCEVSWDKEHNALILNDSKKKKEATIFNPTNGGISYKKVMNLPAYEKTVAPTVSRSQGVFVSRGEIYETGIASFYSKNLDGCRTSSGERYRASEPVAAHKYLPFGTVVRVTALWSNETVDVRIIDRGPFVSGRVIDLSYSAATQLNMLSKGIGPVSLEILYQPEK